MVSVSEEAQISYENLENEQENEDNLLRLERLLEDKSRIQLVSLGHH